MGVFVRADVLYDGRQSDVLRAFIEAYPDLALETAQDAFNRQIKPGLLDELRHYPGPVQYPFEFATAKSRRYYFWKFKERIPYQRSGGYGDGWQVVITVSDNAVVMSVRNSYPAAKWIGGKRQVPGHRKTGWPLYGETIDFWREPAIEVVVEALDRFLKP